MTTIRAETLRFDSDSPGALPQGWEEGITGRGTPAGRCNRTRRRHDFSYGATK